MNNNVTLESVQSDFQQWRRTKAGPRSRIPNDLKTKAASLLTDMKPGKITKALGISSVMLNTWAGVTTKDTGRPREVEFIALAQDTNATPTEELTLSITQPNGNQWCLQGNVSESQLALFIQTIGTLTGGRR